MWRFGGRTALFLVALLGLVLVVVLVGGAVWSGGLQATPELTGVLQTLLAVASLAVPLLIWYLRSRLPRSETEAKKRLSDKVRSVWATEARIRDQDGQHSMPVIWRLRGAAGGGGIVLAGATSYAEAERQMDDLARRFLTLRPRRLILVGGPGAGKTTLAMQLTLALLRTDLGADGVPPLVPVPISASSWTMRDPHKFISWIASQLVETCPDLGSAGTDLPERLVTSFHVVPVIDGLDELDEIPRIQVLEALSSLVGTELPLILTCRTDAFERALRQRSGVLDTATVIEPEPLTNIVAAEHLRRSLRSSAVGEWDELLAGLESSAPHAGPIGIVAEAVSTPLDLGLLTTTYAASGVSPRDLLRPGRFSSPQDLRGHLLNELIPRLIELIPPGRGDHARLRPRRVYDPDRVRRWLEFLADCMAHSQGVMTSAGGVLMPSPPGTRDLRWWGLAMVILPRRVLPWVQVVTWAALGAIAGAISGAVNPSKDIPDASVGAWGMSISGAVVGGISAFFANKALHHLPRYAYTALVSDRPQRALFRRKVLGGMGIGLLSGTFLAGLAQIDPIWNFIIGDPIPFFSSLPKYPLYGIVGGALVGAVIGFYRWVDIAWLENRANTPAGSLRADRSGGLIRTATFTLFSWTVMALLLWSQRQDLDAVQGAIFIGFLITGLILFGGQRAWLAYTMAVMYAACHRNLPFRLMSFLGDAHRLGLLRAVGPVYQFRHAEFQDHLVTRILPQAPSPGARPSWWRRNWMMVAGGLGGLILRELWDIAGILVTLGVAGSIALLGALVWLLRSRNAR